MRICMSFFFGHGFNLPKFHGPYWLPGQVPGRSAGHGPLKKMDTAQHASPFKEHNGRWPSVHTNTALIASELYSFGKLRMSIRKAPPCH